MADVICDTSFLIHMATRQVRNIDRLGQEIGQITFVVPQIVREELEKLSKDDTKRADAQQTLKFVSRLPTMDIGDLTADEALAKYAVGRRVIVATMDRQLKRRLKANGCTVMSFSNDNIVLEPQA